jgi:deoxyhypusine synthase
MDGQYLILSIISFIYKVPLLQSMKPVKQIVTKKGMKVNELAKAMSTSGVFGAGRLAKAADIMEAMMKDKECVVFLGAAGALVPGGMRNILIDMIDDGWIDVFVTTGAMLTHDLVEALGYAHYQGMKDINDAKLNKQKIDRIYDSYMPNEVYGALEDFFNKHFDKLKDETNIKDFLWKLGSLSPKGSILRTCYDKKVPIFCPAIADSGIGLMIWGHLAKGKPNSIKAFDDMRDMLRIAWDSKRAGVIYLGGGVPKNYIQQAMQFSPKSASYGVQITMDRPEPGGSSGAELREGISWGKMNAKGRFVDVICDVTIALPILHAALKDRI